VQRKRPTRCDIDDTIDDFGNLKFEQGVDNTGDFNFRVERLFECMDGGGNVVLEPLEISSGYNPADPYYHYCLSNAVRVTLTYTGHRHMLVGHLLCRPTLKLHLSR